MKAPDALLSELRREVEKVSASWLAGAPTICRESPIPLLQLLLDLDAHLSRGGELPKAWAPPGLVRVQEDDLAALIAEKKRLNQFPGEFQAFVMVSCMVCGAKASSGLIAQGDAQAVRYLPAGWGTVSDAGNEMGFVCSAHDGYVHFGQKP